MQLPAVSCCDSRHVNGQLGSDDAASRDERARSRGPAIAGEVGCPVKRGVKDSLWRSERLSGPHRLAKHEVAAESFKE